MRIDRFSFLKFLRFFLAVFLGATIGILNAEANPLPVTVSPTIQKALHKIIGIKSSNDPTVGTLKGNFQVSSGGTASYSIPIAVPPGTADMAPLLSIAYNSSGSNLPSSNGLLGTGFSLQGLTAIARCPSNLAKNGHIHGVDYTDQDLFCFNGEQLVAIKGAYGADGTEYRTYVDNRSKIISYGRLGNGPAGFKVWTKGGQTAEYAMTPDSQVKAEGKDTVAIWALNKIIDAAGNYLTVSYFKDESKGEYYPNRIDYTGNDKAGLKPYNSVRFFYDTRPDARNWYKAGSKEILDQRMNEIKVYTGETAVYDYKFNYEISPNTYRSRLTSIQECDGSGVCLCPMTFNWQTNEMGWEKADSYNLPNEFAGEGVITADGGQDKGVRFIDLTGSGLPAFVQSTLWANKPFRTVWLNTGNSWQKADSYNLPNEFDGEGVITADGGQDKGVRFVDITGNGLPAFVQSTLWANKPFRTVWLNTGNSWQKADSYNLPNEFAGEGVITTDNGIDKGVRFVDLTGNGLPAFVQSSSWANVLFRTVWLNTGNSWQKAEHYNLPNEQPWEGIITTDDGRDKGVRFIDLTGNGLPAFVQSGRWGVDPAKTTWLNTGSGWQKAEYYNLPSEKLGEGVITDDPGQDKGLRFVDLTGNGLPDFVQGGYWGSVPIRTAWLNTGNGWQKADYYNLPNEKHGEGVITFDPPHDKGVRFIDLTGSGLPAFIQSTFWGSDPIRTTWLNTGSGWQKEEHYNLPNEKTGEGVITDDAGRDKGVRFVDLTGSGLPDFVQSTFWGSDPIRTTWLNKAKKLPDYLIGVTDGYNGQLKIDYESLSNPKVNVYTKEHDAKYPNMDWQGPMYVVYQTASDMGVTDAKIKEQVLSKNVKNSFGNDPLLHVTTYHYAGAKMNHLGYGFLGFHQVTTKDETTGLNVTTTYSQDYNQHIVGQVLNSETRLANGALIASTQNTWDLKTFGSGANIYFVPYTKNILNKSFDFNGGLISTKSTDITVDDYTNPAQIVSSIQDSTGTYTTTTNNTYKNDTDKWLIGELEAATATTSAPNKPSITRHSTFGYDANGLLINTVVEPDDARYMVMTSYMRDGLGNIRKTLISAKGVQDRGASVTYDPTGRFIIQSTDPMGHGISQTYDERFGKVLIATDHNNLTVTNHYDNFGRLIQTDYPDSTQQLVEYNWCNGPNGAVYTVTTHKSGSPTHVEYFDQSNRRVAETTEGMKNQTISLIWNMTYYDDLGRVVEKTLPYFAGDPVYSVRFEYDPLGRVTKTTHPDGTATTVEYHGLTTITTNAAGQKQTKIANARDNLIQVIDNAGKATNYDYDALSNLIKITDSAGNISAITYDNYGHKIAMNDPDKGHWTYQYDPLGQLLSQTDAMKQTTSFDYDLLGRMVKRTDPAGTSTWEYGAALPTIDKLVKVTGVANAKGGKADGNDLIRATKENLVNYERTYGYDKPLGRLVQTTTNINGQSYLTKTSYDGFSRPDIEIYPNAELIVRNKYNSIGYLAEVDNLLTGQMYWKLNEMDAANRIISETNSNGLITNYTYDAKTGFLTDINTELSTSLIVQKKLFPQFTAVNPVFNEVNKINALQNEMQNLHYSYDTIGNMTERHDNANSVTENFSFDALNRLEQNSIAGGRSTYYRYDSLGNIVYKSDVGVYTYGESAGPHAVTSITDGSKNAVFQYNANGGQTLGKINGVERNISYTSYSKPKEITQGKAVTDFYYNADRDSFMRVDKVDGKTTTTLYLGNYELVSIDDGTKVTIEQKYYVGNNTLYIKISDGKENHENTYVLLKDNLGSITDIVDQNANIVQHFTYTPFGEQKQTKGEKPDNPITHHGFTGHEQVEPFNLVHMGGRIYDPMLGRFLTADPTVQAPANPQDLNRYSYCLNNPLRFTDPNGFGWFDWVSDIIKAVCDIIKDINEFFSDIARSLLSNRYVVMALQGIAMGTGNWFLVPLISAASTVACGGNFSDALHAAAMTLATMELANFGNGVSGYFIDKVFKCSCALGKGAITGVVRGATNLAEGKSFKDGFLAGALDGATSGMIADPAKVKLDQVCIMERTAAAGVIGGTEAAATGGNFLDGAETAAFQKLVVDETQAHQTISPHNAKGTELEKLMGPNTAVIGERPLEHLGGFMYSDPLLRLLHLDLAHESVFYNDHGTLKGSYYGPNGTVITDFDGKGNPLNTGSKIGNLNEYEFGSIQSISPVTDADIHLSGFGAGTYILAIPPFITHNCHDSTYQFATRKGMEY